MRKARAAIGGEGAIRQIHTLSTSAKSHRFIKYLSVQSPSKVIEKQKRLDGKLDFDFAFLDKFRMHIKSETLRGYGYSFAQVVSGNDAWRDPPLPPISSNRDSRVIDVGDVQRTELMSAQGARQQLSVYLFGWLLETLPSFPLELVHAGTFDTDLGRVELISAEGKGGFNFLFVLDAKDHLPRAIAIRVFEPKQPPPMLETAGFFDRRFMQETFARLRAERQKRSQTVGEREFQMRFSDHRPVGGVLLPHKITSLIDHDLYEELTFESFEINQPVNPKKFKPPKIKE